MKSFFKNSSGNALLQVVMVGGVLGVASLVTGKLIESQNESQKTFESNLYSRIKTNNIEVSLSSSSTCVENFGDITFAPFTSDGSSNPIERFDSNDDDSFLYELTDLNGSRFAAAYRFVGGVPVIVDGEVPEVFGEGTIELTRMQLGNFRDLNDGPLTMDISDSDAILTEMKGDLRITYSKIMKRRGKADVKKPFSKTITIIFEVQDLQVTTCYSDHGDYLPLGKALACESVGGTYDEAGQVCNYLPLAHGNLAGENTQGNINNNSLVSTDFLKSVFDDDLRSRFLSRYGYNHMVANEEAFDVVDPADSDQINTAFSIGRHGIDNSVWLGKVMKLYENGNQIIFNQAIGVEFSARVNDLEKMEELNFSEESGRGRFCQKISGVLHCMSLRDQFCPQGYYLRGIKTDQNSLTPNCEPVPVPLNCPATHYAASIARDADGNITQINCEKLPHNWAGHCPNNQGINKINSDGTVECLGLYDPSTGLAGKSCAANEFVVGFELVNGSISPKCEKSEAYQECLGLWDHGERIIGYDSNGDIECRKSIQTYSSWNYTGLKTNLVNTGPPPLNTTYLPTGSPTLSCDSANGPNHLGYMNKACHNFCVATNSFSNGGPYSNNPNNTENWTSGMYVGCGSNGDYAVCRCFY